MELAIENCADGLEEYVENNSLWNTYMTEVIEDFANGAFDALTIVIKLILSLCINICVTLEPGNSPRPLLENKFGPSFFFSRSRLVACEISHKLKKERFGRH